MGLDNPFIWFGSVIIKTGLNPLCRAWPVRLHTPRMCHRTWVCNSLDYRNLCFVCAFAMCGYLVSLSDGVGLVVEFDCRCTRLTLPSFHPLIPKEQVLSVELHQLIKRSPNLTPIPQARLETPQDVASSISIPLSGNASLCTNQLRQGWTCAV